MMILSIIGITVAAVVILCVIGLVVGSSAIIIGFGDLLIYGLGIYLITKLICNTIIGKKKKKKKTTKKKDKK